MSSHTTHPTPTPDPAPRRAAATKPIMIILAVLGGLVVLGVILSTSLSSLAGLNHGEAVRTANADGVTNLEVDAQAAHFTLLFDNVTEATLDTSGARAEAWELRRDGDELLVSSPERWFDWCFFGCNVKENRVTLTLPDELNDGTLNAELDLAAGRINADGNFGLLDVELGAGEATANGSATVLNATVNAGEAKLNLADVESAELEVAAGRLVAQLQGTAPKTIEAEVSAGQLDLTVPDTQYAVTSDVSAGGFDNQLQTSSASDHKISVQVAAGEAILRPGDQVNQQ